MTFSPGSEPALSVSGLSRSFGPIQALDSFDATFDHGQVTALVGPNGAGKTTLLLIMAGLLAPDSGTVQVRGVDPMVAPYEVHRMVGWMPDFFGVYDDLTPREYLELFAAAYRIAPEEGGRRAEDLLRQVGLIEKADVKVQTLSRGQKQKLGFARTLVHGPTVLLLDEPASGLDPDARVELRILLRRQAESGVAVVVSSHILTELEEMADSVVFVDRGRCSGSYRLSDLNQTARETRWLVRAQNQDVLITALQESGIAFDVLLGDKVSVAVNGEEGAATLSQQLINRGVRLVEFAPERTRLEDAYMTVGRGAER